MSEKVTQGGCGGGGPWQGDPPAKGNLGGAGGEGPQVGWVGRPELFFYWLQQQHYTTNNLGG